MPRPMPEVLHTARLRLRPWGPEDAAWRTVLVAERAIVRPVQGFDDFLVRERALAEAQGFRAYVVEHDGSPIGYVGLVVGRSTRQEPELAYELLRAHHGHGFATEASRTVVDAARAAGFARLWTTTRPTNAASLRVMGKLGFVPDRTEEDERGEFLWRRLDLGSARIRDT